MMRKPVDVRVPAVPRLAATVQRFVAAHAARHRLLRVAPDGERVLRRLPPRLTVLHWQQHVAWQWSPRFALRKTSVIAGGREASEPAPASAREAPPAPQRLALRAPQRHDVLTTRLFLRETRIASAGSSREVTIRKTIETTEAKRKEAAAAAPVPPPLPRVLARAAAAAPAAAVPRHAAPAAGAPSTALNTRASLAAALAPRTPPAIDIDRLTRDVVRTIDQRIVAHRERMGRS